MITFGVIIKTILGHRFVRSLVTELQCPPECICGDAPLRSAPFVLSWMTSWGENDKPNVNPNEVLDVEGMASTSTADDAEVDVNVVGLHATCSLHPSTNLTKLLSNLPAKTMVLSILQAPGCNFTILDGGQLVDLKSLKALHLQGYAYEEKKQVSGFSPNRISEFIAHKKLMENEINTKGRKMRNLRFALAEDALRPLQNLQLLDLQYVRLVASRENRRSRRYSKEPLSSTTLLDMPLTDFLRFADKVDSFHLPPHLQHLYDDHPLRDNNDMDNNLHPTPNKFQRRLYVNDKGDIIVGVPNEQKQLVEEKKEKNLKDIEIVPYEIYKAETQQQLAPFQNLEKLKYLRVAHARLDKVGPELLDGLHQLHTLTLEFNKIKIIPEDMFVPTSNLRHLSLAHNSLLLLEDRNLKGLSRLLTLDLDNNRLSIIGPASLPPLPSLLTFRLKDNPLKHLLPDAFSSINSTKNIVLGSLKVSMDIHENSFRFLYKLTDLVLNNITMDSLQKTLLTGMPVIQNLEFHGNISKIDYDAFSTTRHLRTLNISQCHLQFLSVDAFFGLKSLVMLDISNNGLTDLSPGTFDHLISLRELFLQHNLLTTLPLGIFLPVPAKLIQLNFNPWQCTCDLLQLRPSITNKARRSSKIECQWDEKLATVCTRTEQRLVYDARVAPLCHEPKELEGNDVYHAALRHLKCSKYHWDPRLLLSEEQNYSKAVPKNKKKETTVVPELKDEPNWLPLSAFTPEPENLDDLLEIAEREGLEEVIEIPKTVKAPEKKSITNVLQNDEPNLLKDFISQNLHDRSKRKRKFKSMMLAKMMKRKEKKRIYLEMMNQQKQKKIKRKILIQTKDEKNPGTSLKQAKNSRIKKSFRLPKRNLERTKR